MSASITTRTSERYSAQYSAGHSERSWSAEIEGEIEGEIEVTSTAALSVMKEQHGMKSHPSTRARSCHE